MDLSEAEKVLRDHGYRFYYAKMLSGRSYDDPEGNEVFLSSQDVLRLATELLRDVV